LFIKIGFDLTKLGQKLIFNCYKVFSKYVFDSRKLNKQRKLSNQIQFKNGFSLKKDIKILRFSLNKFDQANKITLLGESHGVVVKANGS
jgi:hypothetical protein